MRGISITESPRIFRRMSQRTDRLILLLAVVAVLAVTLLPLSGYRAHPHWERVGWIPFADDRSHLWEMAANAALFLPLGWSAARVLGAGRLAVLAASLGGLWLSVAVELAQVFAHGRVSSATDVAFNFAGAALGASLAMRTAERCQRPVGAEGVLSSRSRSQR